MPTPEDFISDLRNLELDKCAWGNFYNNEVDCGCPLTELAISKGFIQRETAKSDALSAGMFKLQQHYNLPQLQHNTVTTKNLTATAATLFPHTFDSAVLVADSGRTPGEPIVGKEKVHELIEDGIERLNSLIERRYTPNGS